MASSPSSLADTSSDICLVSYWNETFDQHSELFILFIITVIKFKSEPHVMNWSLFFFVVKEKHHTVLFISQFYFNFHFVFCSPSNFIIMFWMQSTSSWILKVTEISAAKKQSSSLQQRGSKTSCKIENKIIIRVLLHCLISSHLISPVGKVADLTLKDFSSKMSYKSIFFKLLICF